MESVETEAPRPHWARRVRPEKISQLYASEAAGRLDTGILDDVACGLYARCRSILRATEAHDGRVECPSCAAIVERGARRDALLECDCGWSMPWEKYHRSYQGKKLYGGQAMAYFAGYVERFDAACTPRDYLLAVDWLLHGFHAELTDWPTAPAARNLIDGNIASIVALLDGLAYGDHVDPELRANRERYLETLARSWAGGRQPDSVREKLERRARARARREQKGAAE